MYTFSLLYIKCSTWAHHTDDLKKSALSILHTNFGRQPPILSVPLMHQNALYECRAIAKGHSKSSPHDANITVTVTHAVLLLLRPAARWRVEV